MFGAIASIAGGVLGAFGSTSAADTQASAQQAAAQEQRYMFDKINQQQQPFINQGYSANTTLGDLLGLTGTPGTKVGTTGLNQGYLTQQFDPNNLNNNPAYQFALKQGEQAITNSNTPTQGALSSANQKALTNFNVGTANQWENQYFNQYQEQQNNIFNRLSSIAGLGQNAAANVGNSGTQLGQGIAQATAAAGASQAAGTIGASNALSGGLMNAYLLNKFGGSYGGGGYG